MDSATLERAIADHHGSRIEAAEGAYLQILDSNANQFDALHPLGVVHYQRVNCAKVLKLMRRAVAVRPNAPAWIR